MAVVSLILTDKEVDSEFLHSPRMMFDGFWPGPNSDAVSHLEMMDRLMSAGYSSLAQAEGKCFRRVVWGGGPSIFYSDTRVVLRRLCSDFGRIMMRRCYDMKMPSAFKSSVGDLEVIQSHLESVSPVPPLPLKSTVPIPGTVLTTSSAISTNESESGHHLANGPDTGLTMMKSTDLMGSLHLGKLQVNGRPLRVVLYTRGNSGTKRTIQVEHCDCVTALK